MIWQTKLSRLRIRPHKGFTMIGVLIVLVIIIILSGNYLMPQGENEASLAKHSIDKSRDVAYTANKRVLESQIQIFRLNHPSEIVSVENMRRVNMSVPDCPNCDWIILESGEVFSTIEPPPEERVTTGGNISAPYPQDQGQQGQARPGNRQLDNVRRKIQGPR